MQIHTCCSHPAPVLADREKIGKTFRTFGVIFVIWVRGTIVSNLPVGGRDMREEQVVEERGVLL